VRQRDIDQLKAWGITQVQTEGDILIEAAGAPEGPVGDRALEEKLSASAILKPTSVYENKEIYRLYTDMIEKLDIFFTKLKKNEEPDRKSIELIAQSILQAVRDHQRDVIGFILGGDVQGFAQAKSSVNSAILSVVIGSHMKLPAHKLMQVATGALLHDIGMLRVPIAIVEKQGNLSESELQKMRAHTLISYKMITKELGYPEDVGQIGLQHHERWDGEGYPRKSVGVDIDILARIVSVADAFEAMVSEKSYRNAMMGYSAMKSLLSDNSRRFDPEVLRVLIKCMGIYPIGSIVLLNTSAIARVMDVHPDAPLRPQLRVIIDEFGHQYGNEEGDVVDLLTERTLFIARAIDPKDFLEG
jgi:HD-GYP domain-containing protein (c-di-GMP phosphodiesterase class II)